MEVISRLRPFRLGSVINILLILIAFVFPFQALLSSYLIATLLMVVIVALFTKKLIIAPPDGYFYVVTGLYLINILGLIYTSDLNYGLRALETKASLLVLPFIFIALKKQKLNTHLILKSFVLGVLLASAICLSYAFWQQYQFNQFTSINWFFFSYRDLTSVIDIHPIYLAFYVSFAGILVLFYSASLLNEKKIQLVIWMIFIYLFLFIMLFLLSSRINIAGHLLLTFFLILYISFKTRKWKPLSIWAIVMLVLISVLLNTLKISKERIYEALNLNQQTEYIQKWDDGTNNSVNVRIIKWRAAMDIIKDNLIIGVGTGDAQGELGRAYLNYNFDEGIDRKFNVHNEYLQHLLVFGIIGLILLLINIVIPIYTSIKRANLIYFSFFFLFFFFALTESVLEVQKGVVAFSFFGSLFYFNNNSALDTKI